MIKKHLKFLCVIGVIAVTFPSAAIAEEGKVAVGVTGGTLGIGPEVSIAISDTVAIRANATFLSVSRGFSSTNIDYDGDVELGSYGLMVDYHIGAGGFRVSAGGRINNNRAIVKASPSIPVNIFGTVYPPLTIGEISGRFDFKGLAPALTLGYASRSEKGIKFGFEAGALFQGSPKLSSFKFSGIGVRVPDIVAEQLSLQDDVDNFKIYPIVQLSISHRF